MSALSPKTTAVLSAYVRGWTPGTPLPADVLAARLEDSARYQAERAADECDPGERAFRRELSVGAFVRARELRGGSSPEWLAAVARVRAEKAARKSEAAS